MADYTFNNHPDLVRHWPEYQALQAFEDGKVSEVLPYLVPHASESDGSIEGKRQFQNRAERAYNVNFCSPYLFLHWGHMSQPITIAGIDSEPMAAISEDATGYRESAEQVSRERLYTYIHYGRVGTLVDGPNAIADSQEEAAVDNERSYQRIYCPQEIRYWSYFSHGPRKGQLQEVVVDDGVMRDGGKSYRCFRRFFQPEGLAAGFQWFKLKQKAEEAKASLMSDAPVECEITDAGTGGLTEIPFSIMGDGPNESFIKDVWPLNKAHFNKKSILSNIIYNQGFQRIFVTGARKEELTKVTEWTITLLSAPDARVLEIPPGNPAACQEEIAALEREMHRRAKFQFNQLADDTRAVQSAESKAKDLIVQVVIYNNTLDYLERVERDIFRFHAMFEGQNPDAIEVQIARDYGLADETVESLILQTISSEAKAMNVPALAKEILKIWAAKPRYIPNENETEDEIRQRMFEAIEAAEDNRSSALDNFRAAGGSFVSQEDPKQASEPAKVDPANQPPIDPDAKTEDSEGY